MQAMSQRRQSDIWTTRSLLDWTQAYLQRKGMDSPRLAAEMLLAHILEVDRIKLYLDLDRPASELERAAFRDLVERAAGHEPVDYLVGRCPFYTLMFKVNPDVLIPRPSTETLVDHIIQHSRRTPGFHHPVIADIGTGSGIIAITVARHLPEAQIVATDISGEAIAIARENARALGVEDRISFIQGDLLEPLAGRTFHYLASNPPYISDAEWAEVLPNVKEFEPALALRGGADGLQILGPLIAQGPDYLQTPGQLVLEIASSQKDAALALVHDSEMLEHAHLLCDHETLPRVLVADHKEAGN